MKFRMITFWIILFATGTLCLAVGAVRLPRKSPPTPSVPSTPAVQPADASVIPLRVAQPSTGVAIPDESSRTTLGLPGDWSIRDRLPATSTKHPSSMAGQTVASSRSGTSLPRSLPRTSGGPAPYQEPEPWPFHRSGATTPSVNAGSAASAVTAHPPVADWPYQRSTSQSVASHSTPAFNRTPQQADPQYRSGNSGHSNSYSQPHRPGTGSHQQDQSEYLRTQKYSSPDDLLNPGLAFGTPSRTGARSAPATSMSPAQETFNTSRPVLPQPAPTEHSPLQPSLSSLPAPQPPQGSQQTVLEAGHAGPSGRVIHAYSESVTPRNQLTVGQWTGPHDRPVQSIQTVRFDACPDCEDVQRIPAESLVNPYAARASRYPDSVSLPRQSGQLVELPRDYAPWWEEVINKPLRAATTTQPINVESLILKAIEHSPQVTAFRIDPIIRETQILEEAAEFDWQSFIETRYDDTNDPIGNQLTTGDNSDRFVDRHLTSRLGLEKRMAQGGRLDVAQNFGLQNNNSTFLIPQQQGTSRLELNFTQPLLRGAGQTYNESRTVLAMLDHQISEDELQESLQDHLLEVYTTYWNLYRARAVRLQKERLLRRAQEVEQKLTARQGIDTVRRQVLRARAAVASRQSEIARADMEVRNSESRLRLLVNSPDLKRNTIIELLPLEAPMSDYLNVSMRGSVETALQNRPDIRRAIKQMKETAVRLEVSKNELLPKLDLVLGTYVAGLQGKSQIDTAWTNQFREGRPGYTVGLTLQYPLGNRAARARYARREWEVARTLKEFEASVESSMTEVELAVREFETSYQEMLSRFQSMVAADTEATYLLERWRLLPGTDQTTSFLLEDVLDAQERVAVEEQNFVEAQVAYVLSVVRLKRASGILLSCDCGDSPVSFMTPAPRGIAQPRQMPLPVDQKPAISDGESSENRLTPPLPVLPRNSTAAPQEQPSTKPPGRNAASENFNPAIIPLPDPSDSSGQSRSEL